jgi:BlaI family transcriptional regulator, penicillinase repressor
MKRKSQTPRPTAGEWEILEVLWKRGGATVRQVHESLPAKRPSQYTTTLKLMQIMTEKGLVTRDESQRAHQYRALIARDESQARLVDELLQRVFGGSAARLVQAAIGGRKASAEELAEIRRILEEASTEEGNAGASTARRRKP